MSNIDENQVITDFRVSTIAVREQRYNASLFLFVFE